MRKARTMQTRMNRISIVAATLLVVLTLSGCDLFASADKRVEHAAALVDKGDFQTAAIELRNVLQKNPDHASARLLLARTSLMLGDPKAAEKDLRRAVELGVKPAQSARLDAEIKRALGEFDKLATELAGPRPGLGEPERLLQLGYAKLGLNKPSEAEASFKSALAAKPAGDLAAEVRGGLAQSLAAQGDFDAAFKELDEALRAAPDFAVTSLTKGSLLLQRGQYAQAEQVLAAVNLDNAKPPLSLGDRVKVLGGLVESRLALNKLPEAKQALGQLETSAPQSVMYLFLHGRVAMAEGKSDQAVADLQKVVAAAPEFVLGQFMLGLAYVRNGDNSLAEAQFQKVVESSPDNIEARKLLAQSRLQAGRPASASDALAPLVQAGTDDPEVFALLGRAKLLQGQRMEGEALLEKGAASAPDSPQLQMDLAASYLAAADPARALEVIAKVPDEAGGQRKRQIQLMAAAAGKDKAHARAEIDALIAKNPTDVQLLNLAAGWLASQKDIAASRACLSRALQAKPNDAPTLVNVAKLDLVEGKPEDARKSLEKALAAEPANGSVLASLVSLADSRGDRASAKQWLEEWRKRDPKAPQPRLELARRAFAARDGGGARKLVDEAVGIAPKRAELQAAAGRVLFEARSFDEALAHFRLAADLNAQEPQYWLFAANAQVALGRPEAARESLGKALSIRPDWPPAIIMLAQIESSAGRTDAALALAEKLQANPSDAAAGFGLEGEIRLAARQYAEAGKAFAQSGALKPSQQAAFGQYRARRSGGLPQPEQPLVEWLQRSPNDAAARFAVAETYGSRGDTKAAIHEYEALAASSPNSAPVLNNLAWAYQAVGDDRAEATASRAYQLAPKSAAVADTYGWILFGKGKVDEAVKYLRQAHENGKENMEIQYHLGAALAKSGQTEEAHRLLQEAVAGGGQAPWVEDARRTLGGPK
jgi:putative PEP-CTERM system TPR-repeat lipoprotein